VPPQDMGYSPFCADRSLNRNLSSAATANVFVAGVRGSNRHK